jgi:hypothetical protein
MFVERTSRAHLRLLVIVFVMTPATRARAQDTLYALTAYVGAGYTRNMSPYTGVAGLTLRHDRDGMGAFARVMWTPEHLLSVGLETGLARVYAVNAGAVASSYGPTEYRSVLNVVPLSLMFSMHITERLEGYIGSTSYLLFSRTQSFGNSTFGTMMSIGFSVAFSYMWVVNEEWSAGAEIKWYHIEKSQDDNVSMQAAVSYRLLRW